MSDSNNTGKVIGGVLLGAAIGAALGLLLAPDKGSETRKKMVKGIKDLADDLKAAFDQAAEEEETTGEDAGKTTVNGTA